MVFFFWRRKIVSDYLEDEEGATLTDQLSRIGGQRMEGGKDSPAAFGFCRFSFRSKRWESNTSHLL